MTRVISRIRAVLSVEIPLPDFFRHLTVAAVARRLAGAGLLLRGVLGRPGARLLLRGVLGLILALVVLDLVALQLARGALRRAEERVAAEGSSLDAYALFPEVEAPAENAHGYLDAAGQIFEALDEASRKPGEPLPMRRALSELRDNFRFSEEPPTAEDIELFRRKVEHHRLVLDVIDAALPLERAHFDFDRQVPMYAANDPELIWRLRISDLLGARARLALAEGRGDEAWRNVYAMFRLATWCSQEGPTLAHQLCASTLVRYATAIAMGLLRAVVPGQGEMEDVLAEARRWDPQATYDFVLELERASFVTSLLDERGLEYRYPQTPVARWLLSRPLRPWLHWNLAAYSDAMTKLSADCRQPAYRREKVHYPVPRWATLARSLGLGPKNYFNACDLRDQTIAGIDLMEIAFRLEDHRRQSGSYPSSLDALAGVPAKDPFSGGPYVYRLTEGGAVVYSVGANRSDDGGTPPPPKAKRKAYLGDMVWRLGE